MKMKRDFVLKTVQNWQMFFTDIISSQAYNENLKYGLTVTVEG